MMAGRILGLGVDMVGVERIERAVARHGSDFLREFLLPSEFDACSRSPRPLLASATIFAAKEALLKALGTGRSGRIGWKDVEVSCPGGRPLQVRLRGEAGLLARARGVRRILCDVSWRRPRARSVLALGWVVLEGEPAGPAGIAPAGGEEQTQRNAREEDVR